VYLFDYKKEGTTITFSYHTDADDAFVSLPLLCYPGYYAVLDDGMQLRVDKGEKNRVCVYLPKNTETGTVTLKYDFWRLFK